MTARRTIKDGPFCWQSKADLRRIADACEGRTDRALILSVYLALTWVASDQQSDTFTESKTRIAERAGVSYRKVADALSFLARLGVLTMTENVIDGTKERGPNTYTLGTTCTTSGTTCLRLGTDEKTTPCRDYKKESIEESLERVPAGAGSGRSSRFTPPTPEEVAAYSVEIGYPLDGAGWCDSYAAKGWSVGKSKMKDWRAAVRNWKRNGYKLGAPTTRPTAPEAAVRRVSAA